MDCFLNFCSPFLQLRVSTYLLLVELLSNEGQQNGIVYITHSRVRFAASRALAWNSPYSPTVRQHTQGYMGAHRKEMKLLIQFIAEGFPGTIKAAHVCFPDYRSTTA